MLFIPASVNTCKPGVCGQCYIVSLLLAQPSKEEGEGSAYQSSSWGTVCSGGERHQRWKAWSQSSHRICFSGSSFPPHTLQPQNLHFRLSLSLQWRQSGFFFLDSPSPSVETNNSFSQVCVWPVFINKWMGGMCVKQI